MITFRNDEQATFVEMRDEFEIFIISNSMFHFSTGGALASVVDGRKLIVFSEHYMDVAKPIWNALFWHEAGHHRLNHSFAEPGPTRDRQEAEADYYAAVHAGWPAIVLMLIWVHIGLLAEALHPRRFITQVIAGATLRMAKKKGLPGELYELNKLEKAVMECTAYTMYPIWLLFSERKAAAIYFKETIGRLYRLCRLAIASH